MLAIERLDVHYGRAHALQQVSLTLDQGVLAVVGRNGMGKTTLCNAITGLVRATGSIRFHGPGVDRAAGEPDHAARHRLRAAGAPGLAFADRGRASPAGGAIEQGPVDRRARLPDVSAPRGAQVERRRRAFGRRAADARDRARAAVEPAAAGDGRAHRGPRAGDRAAGRGDAEVARGRRRDRGAADRAEPGCGHRGGRYGERDGERAHRALDAGNGTRGGSRAAAAPAWRQGRGRRGDRARAQSPSRRPRRSGSSRCSAPRPVEMPACRDRTRSARLYALGIGGHRSSGGAGCRAATGGGARSGGPSRRVPRRGQHGARRVCRGHVRHQGSRTGLPAQLPREARPARGDRGPVHVGQAVGGDGASARSGALPSAGRARGVHRRARQRGDRDGARVRAFRRAPARPGRPDFRRRLGQHRARDAGDAATARSACPR